MSRSIRGILLACIVVAFVMTACGLFGATNAEVIGRYKSQFAQLRNDFKAIAQNLPEYTADQRPVTPLDPAPDYRSTRGQPGNTDILMYEHLVDADSDLNDDAHIDLLLSGFLRTGLLWTGSKNPLDESVLRKHTDGSLEKELQIDLQTRYVGVVKVLTYVPPAAASAEEFSGGRVSMAGYLVDLRTKQAVCSFGASAKADADVEYEHKQSEDPKLALERAVQSSLWSNARKQFIDTAAKTCGGSFVIEK